ncbi:MAG: glycosyltransferase [Lachnospiraceae bacterium]|nr:glycosyltransferase [Lachnospiraceae bacterium]
MAEILVLDIAASKTGALSVLRDFYDYVAEASRRRTGDGVRDRWIFVTGAKDILKETFLPDIEIIVREDVKASQAARLKFELFTGGKWVNSLSPDIVFSLENLLPRGINRNIRQVVYIHQPVGFQKTKKFSVIKKNEREQGIYQRFYHPLIIGSALRADAAIVQTEWMRRALLEQTGIDPARAYRVSPEIPDFSSYVNQGEFDRNRFFYPASDLPYKNHSVIEKARLILEAQGCSPEVMYTKDRTYPREEVLKEYNRSTLLFPSYIETYGMPLGEARQFGNPIIAADTGFAREVLKDYDNKYFFDPFDAEKLAALMRRVIEGEILPVKPHPYTEHGNSYARLVDIIRNTAGSH